MPFVSWNAELGKWAGTCSRCGMGGFFDIQATKVYAGKQIDVLFCPAQHAFVVEYRENRKHEILTVYPIEVQSSVPSWLPDEYHSTYSEMLDAYSRAKYRSMIACCGLLIEAHINSIIKNPGDKKKSLFDRLEILVKQGKIDADQFSEGTIVRLTRKDVLHPQDFLKEVTQADAKEVLDSVIAYLERTFKFRIAKALPAAKKEDISGESAQTQ